MTSKEFTIWLQGFLDGNEDLTVEGVEFIKNKMKEVVDPPQGCDNYPLPPNDLYKPNPYIIYEYNTCPMGGYHEYPDMWHGIFPPPCKKCGQSFNTYTTPIWQPIGPITSFVTPADSKPGDTFDVKFPGVRCFQGGLGEDMSYAEFCIPIKYNPDVNMVDLQQDMLKLSNDINKDAARLAPQPQMTAEDYAFFTNGESIQKIANAIEKGWFNSQPPLRDAYIEFEFELTDEDRVKLDTDKKYARFKAPIKRVPEELKKYGAGEYMFDIKSTDGQEIFKELIGRKLKELSTSEKTVKENFREGYIPVQPLLEYLEKEGVEERVIWGLKEYFLFHKHNL